MDSLGSLCLRSGSTDARICIFFPLELSHKLMLHWGRRGGWRRDWKWNEIPAVFAGRPVQSRRRGQREPREPEQQPVGAEPGLRQPEQPDRRHRQRRERAQIHTGKNPSASRRRDWRPSLRNITRGGEVATSSSRLQEALPLVTTSVRTKALSYLAVSQVGNHFSAGVESELVEFQ